METKKILSGIIFVICGLLLVLFKTGYNLFGTFFGNKCVTSISLYQLVLLDALQLAAGATGLFSQGVTAVVHGCSVCALGPSVKLTHSWRGGN